MGTAGLTSRSSARLWAMAAVLLSTVLLATLMPVPAHADPPCTSPSYLDPFACLEVLVEYLPGAFDHDAFAAEFGAARIFDLPELELTLFRVDTDLQHQRVLLEGGAFPGVDEVRPNSRLVIPECRQFAIGVIELGHAPEDVGNQPAIAAIGAPSAWPLYDGTGVRVAVIDTGVDPDHPNLLGHLGPGIDFIDDDADPRETRNGIDDDGDSRIDPGYGHGTAIASLVAGVAPGAELMIIRAIDDECLASALAVTRGIVEAVRGGASIINLSLGMREDYRYIERAIRYAREAGAVVVVAAGNTGNDPEEFPARERGALAVAATDVIGVKAPDSSYGSAVDLVAPGLDILGAYPGLSWIRASGTSHAAALVSGAMAIALQRNGCANGESVREDLEDTARSVDDLPGNGPYRGDLGEGMVDLTETPDLGQALAEVGELLLAKSTPELVSYHWQVGGEPPTLATRIYSVESAGELALASNNCPGCPAASLRLRCEASAVDRVCPELAPDLLVDPVRLLFVQAVASCGGVDAEPEP